MVDVKMEKTQLNGHVSFFYTAHYNWEWVVQDGMKEIQSELQEEVVECRFVERFQSLPSLNHSQQNESKAKNLQEKVQYSLFRIDVVAENSVIAKIRLTSPIFQRLDAKDLFFHKSFTAHKQQTCPYLPNTILISWDHLENKTVEEQRECLQTLLPLFPSYPAVLKAPMGSGGFGIYFVYHHEDIREVMNHHAERAKKDESVLRRLKSQYECESISLSWSLQQFIQPIKCQLDPTSSMQRTQVRAYVIECNDRLYLYSDYEVRCPSWLFDLEAVLAEEQRSYGSEPERSKHKRDKPWEDSVEDECCGEGFARPYNEGRDKKRTYRLMIDEIPDLVPSIPTITRNLLQCFRDLKPCLLKEKREELAKNQRPSEDDGINKACLAVIGIDLLVSKIDEEYGIGIVEVNNNPAMPGKGKLMSERYERHLTALQKAFVGLSLHHSLPHSLRDREGSSLSQFITEQSLRFIEI